MPDRGRLANDAPIGRRVAYWRGRRNMSQQLFADRLGKSKSWVDKVERGVRSLDRYSVLHEIAGVLRVDIAQLLGNAGSPAGGRRSGNPPGDRLGNDPHNSDLPGNDERGDDRQGLDRLRGMLERYPLIVPPSDGDPGALADLDGAVEHAWLAYQHADYPRLLLGLPRLLADARAADHHHTGDDGTRAAHLLGQAYQITSSVLRKLGDHELARLAADRAVAASVRAGDPLLAGVATSRAGNALLALGRTRAALETQVAAAHQLAPVTTQPTDPARLSVFGSLLLQGAMAAAHLGEHTTVRDLLTAAEQAATALGDDQSYYWTSFGPTNLQLHRIAAAVELRDGGQAREAHRLIDPRALGRLVPERRAHHLLDLARAHTQAGDLTAAGEALMDAERRAPAEIRHRPAAHQAMATILERTRGTPAAPITELARRMGLTV